MTMILSGNLKIDRDENWVYLNGQKVYEFKFWKLNKELGWESWIFDGVIYSSSYKKATEKYFDLK